MFICLLAQNLDLRDLGVIFSCSLQQILLLHRRQSNRQLSGVYLFLKSASKPQNGV